MRSNDIQLTISCHGARASLYRARLGSRHTKFNTGLGCILTSPYENRTYCQGVMSFLKWSVLRRAACLS